MKKMLSTAVALAAAVALPNAASASTIINNGFEAGPIGTGAPTGWSTNNASLVQTASSFRGYSAVQGSNFAVITAGAVNISTVLSQIFDMAAGETIAFAVAFATDDYLPFNDSGALAIFDFSNSIASTLFTQTVGGSGNVSGGSYNGPWTTVSFTAPVAGSYSVSASVRNVQDSSLPSYLLLDSSAVPEPGTWLLMLLGLGAVGFSMRQRKNLRVNFA